MTGWLGAAYPWTKAAHIVFVIFWMAGLFMIGRYLVHQRGVPADSDEHRNWIRRSVILRRVILTPSLLLSWGLGVALMLNLGLAGQGWLHMKLLFVLLLTAWHGWAVSVSKKMAGGERPMAERTLRVVNETPAIAIILIVVLAVVKPF